METMISGLIAGLGCRRDCSVEAIAALVERACRQTGRHVIGLAIPDFKAGEPGLQAAARQLGLPLTLVGVAALTEAQSRCPTRSAHALAATGVASVAEACALAAAGTGAQLVLPRIVGKGVTCALAGFAAA